MQTNHIYQMKRKFIWSLSSMKQHLLNSKKKTDINLSWLLNKFMNLKIKNACKHKLKRMKEMKSVNLQVLTVWKEMKIKTWKRFLRRALDNSNLLNCQVSKASSCGVLIKYLLDLLHTLQRSLTQFCPDTRCDLRLFNYQKVFRVLIKHIQSIWKAST